MSEKVKKLRLQIEQIVKSKRIDNTRKLRLIRRQLPKLRRLGYVVEVKLGKEGKRGSLSGMRRVNSQPLETHALP